MTQQVISRQTTPASVRAASQARARVMENLRAGQITKAQATQFLGEVRKVQFGQEDPKHLEQFGLREPIGAVAQIRARNAQIDRITQQLQQRDIRAGRSPEPLKTEALATANTLKETLKETGMFVADALVPGLWARNWDKLSTKERVLNIGLDALFLVPVIGTIGSRIIKGSRAAVRTSVRDTIKALPVPDLPPAQRAALSSRQAATQRNIDFQFNRLNDAVRTGNAKTISESASILQRELRSIGLEQPASRFATLSREADDFARIIVNQQRSIERFQLTPSRAIGDRIQKNITQVTNPFARLSPDVAVSRRAGLESILKKASAKVEASQEKRAAKAFEKATEKLPEQSPFRTRRQARAAQLPKKTTPEELKALRERARRTQVKVITKEAVPSELEEVLKRDVRATRREVPGKGAEEARRFERERAATIQRSSRELAQRERSQQIRKEFESKRRQERLSTERTRREAADRRIRATRERRRVRERELVREKEARQVTARPRARPVVKTRVRPVVGPRAKPRTKTTAKPKPTGLPRIISKPAKEPARAAPTRKPAPVPAPRSGPSGGPREDATPGPVPTPTPTPSPGPKPTPGPGTGGGPRPVSPPPTPSTGPTPEPSKPGNGKPARRFVPAAGDGVDQQPVRDISKESRALPVNVVAFRQGLFWYTKDLTTGKQTVMDDPPAGLPDTGTPRESLTILKRGPTRPTQQTIDMGAVTAILGRRGRTIRYES